jgi:quercetin dioxygenase-like cupin family protein
MDVEAKQFGNLYGSLYSFAEIGDKLPMHNHDERTVHVTFILDGSFKIHGSGWEIEAKAGQFLDWKPNQAHELIALEPNSRFLNIMKNVTNEEQL